MKRRLSIASFALAMLHAAVGPLTAGTVSVTAYSNTDGVALTEALMSSDPFSVQRATQLARLQGTSADAFASSIVNGRTVRKGAGGEGWYYDGGQRKVIYFDSQAGTGEYFVSAPLGVTTARLAIQVRAAGDPLAFDPATPPVPSPEIGAYPSQGFFAERKFHVALTDDVSTLQGRVGDVNNDGVVDAVDATLVGDRLGNAGEGQLGDLNNDGIVDLADVTIVAANFGQVGFTQTELFHGSARLNGPDTGLPALITSGDLDARLTFEIVPSPNPGQTRYQAAVLTPFVTLAFAEVRVNTPFTLNMDELMNYNRPDVPGTVPPLEDVPAGVVAALAGSFVTELFVMEDEGLRYAIMPVPEPASGLLMLTALVALALSARRHRR